MAPRENARPQPERITYRAFAVETKQTFSKLQTQSPSTNQQQPVLRAKTTSHSIRRIDFKGTPGPTTNPGNRENGLQLLQGGLEPVQERGTRHEVFVELRISAPSLDNRACNELRISSPFFCSCAFLHCCSQEEYGKRRVRRGAFHLPSPPSPSLPPPPPPGENRNRNDPK